MSLFYIKAKVSVRVRGISGPFEKIASHLVSASNPEEARIKFETHVSATHSNMIPDTISYEYLEVASQIS